MENGGLLYKGFFQSPSLNKVIDTQNMVFGNKCRFIPSAIASSDATRDVNILFVDTVLNRTDEFEIFIEFYSSLNKNNYCLSGEMTSDWWKCPGINIDYNSTKQRFYVNCRAGTTSSTTWNESGWVHSIDKDVAIVANQRNTIRFTHFKDTDSYRLLVNNIHAADWTDSTSYYGTVRLGIGGIYTNQNSLLYNPNSNSDYLTSRSYFKINGAFLDRPWTS